MAQTLDTYLGLITSLYRNQPLFIGLCTSQVQPLVDLQRVLEDIREGFDLDDGVGVQLDHVGEWVGRSRFLETPLEGVYFSWGESGVGWQQGTWKGPYDPDTGLVSLPDDHYRTLLRGKVAANSWDGTTEGAYGVWEAVFGDTGMIIVIQDNQDMTMTVGVAGICPDAVSKALLVGGYIPLKPSGVAIGYYAVTPEGGQLFAWGGESNALGGWNAGSWPETLVP
ncbi:MAG: hypothetical protein CL942_08495 [Desulfovibrio sp.]|nr:hypothetical protein [Desulfovibrio sp.]|tara:strand:+ start:28252 stop:28923 length:672 start_codon:yes stop_codon:yes gene_type:complete